ncbi:MAG TPA: tRNA uridine-5-carboxymethylaminomethyl(34) synthesis enzyme MnmG [Erysipelotrichaceae bacterium]|nr:tRNA uridine-5-carboxymethylaminomethyl(34) synthesis enzyme MnmG [Erysipelotrichaceae bacterium]
MTDYDVIVVGGGHAGLEAAFAAAHLNKKTLLVTSNIKMMGNMPCNPSIGGSAKGIVVREIDALGGMMGKAADHHYLQMKMLNTGKGPGVRCLRAQQDKKGYPLYMQKLALSTDNLTVKEGMVISLICEDRKIAGVVLKDGTRLSSKATILTTGTYMESQIFYGHEVKDEGPDGEEPSLGLAPFLRSIGIETIRLKTGTPPRIKRDSIDFSRATPQPGMDQKLAFSYETEEFIPLDQQELCYLIYTTPKTHEIIREHLEDSALYGGLVTGIGPRYCPSIESKIVTFADKERHQLFLEPESRHTDSIYIQGFATSMPKDVQEEMVRSLPGFENAVFLKYAYAIEYDAVKTEEYGPSLEMKKWPGLYVAGQICGTSGYEEAAGLGLIAGINACLKIDGKEPLVLRRDQAYIGVMIDDLVTKGTEEPYRLMSSRAEFRLILRHDNADIRLTEIGYKIGLISEERYRKFSKKISDIDQAVEVLKSTYLGTKKEVNKYLKSINSKELTGGIQAFELLKRPRVRYIDIIKFIPALKSIDADEDTMEEIEILAKYEGYIAKQIREAKNMAKLEEMKIPKDMDFLNMNGLALEARQRMDKIKPLTIGQASRISGVNPSDISVLIFNIKKVQNEQE